MLGTVACYSPQLMLGTVACYSPQLMLGTVACYSPQLMSTIAMPWQVSYNERTMPIRGTTVNVGPVNRDLFPDYVITLQANERLVGAFGSAGPLFSDSAVSVLYNLGFWTSTGAQHGPYGSSQGSGFSFRGPIYGFYGGVFDRYDFLSGIGKPPTPEAFGTDLVLLEVLQPMRCKNLEWAHFRIT
jgi:hypothetical protein